MDLQQLLETQEIERATEILLAPLNYPDIIPTVIPLVLGLIVLELYFGRYETETLGWNTALGNSVMWVGTGITLLLTETLQTTPQTYAVYLLIAVGAITAYLNFNHIWSEKIAFSALAAFPVYTYAYITVVLVKTEIPISALSLRASLLLVITLFIADIIIKKLETPKDQINF